MSLFFDYFKKNLKWYFIQKAGPIAAVVHGGARALDTARERILWMRLQAYPDTCDDQFVAVHGEARGIFQRQNESIEKYRIRVIKAYAWQLLGGKNAGLPQILEHYGYGKTFVHNMRDEDPERWAEFKVKLPLSGDQVMAENDFVAMDEIVNDQKPARSKLAAITIEKSKNGSINSGGVIRESKKLTLCTYSSHSVETSPRTIGGAVRQSSKKIILAHAFELNIKNSSPTYTATAIRTVNKLKIGANQYV